MMNIVVFIAGFVIGVIVVALAIELGMKKKPTSEPSSRATQYWSIEEIRNPRIIAESLGDDVSLPRNSKLVVNQYTSKDPLQGMAVKTHAGIKGNFILGDDRALILAGAIKKNEIGVWTVEKEILRKLNAYFEQSWSKGEPISWEETEEPVTKDTHPKQHDGHARRQSPPKA